jgi:hypothetical protein
VRLLQDAQSAGLRVALVNILTLDYGSPVQDMGQAAIDAATALHGQLGQIYTGKSDAELWAMEGNTPMIGVNDSQGEVFSIDDAKRLADFAVQKGIQELSYWAVGRDKACSGTGTLSDDCSGTEQSDHQFLTTFNAVTTTAPGTAPAPAASGSPAPQASGTPEARHPATLQLTADAPGGSGSGKTIQNAFTTGYTWFDNTPRGSAQIFAPVLHQQAGGTGTWKDPITLAVGHTINGGKDTLDYPAGTRFYIPTIRRYFIVEDACGDGGSPQNGACHKLDTAPQGATTWLDLYIGGGSGDNESAVQDCAGRMTGLKTVIQDPADGLPVVEGPLFSNGKCTTTYGDN